MLSGSDTDDSGDGDDDVLMLTSSAPCAHVLLQSAVGKMPVGAVALSSRQIISATHIQLLGTTH